MTDIYCRPENNANINQKKKDETIMEKKDENKYKFMAEIIDKEQNMYFAKQNVVGVGTGHKIRKGENIGEDCITFFVSQKLDKSILRDDDLIPEKIYELQTDVMETGEIFAGNVLLNHTKREELGIELLTQRVRPAMGGFSVGHYKITAGTIATCVYDSPGDLGYGIPSKFYILSCNHVLANSNDAMIGDPILQPGPFDGGTIPDDIIARLSRFVPIRFSTSTSTPINYVDAAIAEGEFQDLNREIYWIGYVKQVNSNSKIGDLIKKTGRTTNFSTGKILSNNATVNVNYGGGRVARFANQIITSLVASGGDSGSLICDTSDGAVGLLFAGSPQINVVNNISFVQNLLGIRFRP